MIEQETKKIAVYGSLKQGFYNHDRFDLGDPIARGTVRGSMYLVGSFPFLYREGVDKEERVREHEVEVYEVDVYTYNAIEMMEKGAGYVPHAINIDGHSCTIFFTKDDHHYKDNWIEAYA